MKITSLDDIEIYKSALTLARNIYSITKNSALSRDFSLVDQVRRSSLSIAANIAKGYGRRTTRICK